METLTKQTSRIAHSKVDKKSRQEIILSTLKHCQYPLSAYGISTRCSLSYYQVNKRLKELRDLEQIEIVCKLHDLDGGVRAAYRLI